MNAERDVLKRLLIAESDLNRSLLVDDCEGWVVQAHAVVARWEGWAAWGNAAVVLLAGCCRPRSSPHATPRPPVSRWQLALDALQIARSIWSAWGDARASSTRA